MTSLQVLYTKTKRGLDIRYALMGHASGGLFDEIAAFKTVEKAIQFQMLVDAQILEDSVAEDVDNDEFQNLPFPEVANAGV